MVSGLELAGPRVATILALRLRRMSARGLRGRPFLGSEDEDGAEVVDVRQGGAGDDQIAQRFEE
jgi:hypothetical protein